MRIHGWNLFLGIVSLFFVYKWMDIETNDGQIGFILALLAGTLNFQWAFENE